MAGDAKSENKIFQIVMVMITTIVAPVSVYFLTHPSDPKTAAALQPTSALISEVGGLAITSTSPASEIGSPLATPTTPAEATFTFTPTLAELTATSTPLTPTLEASSTPTAQSPIVTPTTTETPTVQVIQPSPTISGVTALQGIIPAGDPVVVNEIAVQLITEEIKVEDDLVRITLHVRNLSSKTQQFTYAVRSITLVDSHKDSLEPLAGEKKDACDKKDFDAKKTIELEPDQEIVLQSVEASQVTGWCAPKVTDLLPLYRVTTKDPPQSIQILFGKFGPFDQFGFQIDF